MSQLHRLETNIYNDGYHIRVAVYCGLARRRSFALAADVHYNPHYCTSNGDNRGRSFFAIAIPFYYFETTTVFMHGLRARTSNPTVSSQLQPNILPFLDLLQNALISFLFPSWYFLAPHPYKIAANTSRHAGRHKKHNNEPLPIGSKQFAASYTFQKIRFLGPASEAVTPCTSNKHARVPLARKWVFDLLK